MEQSRDPEERLLNLLASISRARESLPLLLRSFSSPTSSTTTPLDLSLIYRQRSNNAVSSITNLRDELLDLQSVFDECEKSEREDGVGIVVRKRKLHGRGGWERLAEVLSGGLAVDAYNGNAKKSKGKQKAFVGTLGDVGGANGLIDWLERWKVTHPRCTLETRGGEGGGEHREIRMVLRGVMRIVLMLHWHNGTIQVDRVACFGLKEMDKASYARSQYSLFQTITSQAMERIGQIAIRTGTSGHSNLEEVLDFVANPPLPF